MTAIAILMSAITIRSPCSGRRALARQRSDRASSRQGQDYTGGLRVFLRDDWPFAGADPPAATFPLQSRSTRRTSPDAFHIPVYAPAGRRLCRLRRALGCRSPALSDVRTLLCSRLGKFFVLADVAAEARWKSRDERDRLISQRKKLSHNYDLANAINYMPHR